MDNGTLPLHAVGTFLGEIGTNCPSKNMVELYRKKGIPSFYGVFDHKPLLNLYSNLTNMDIGAYHGIAFLHH